MIKSMTGFGRSEVGTEIRKITVEMKAVNHRYCELSLKMPKKLSIFDAAIRNQLKKYINSDSAGSVASNCFAVRIGPSA